MGRRRGSSVGARLVAAACALAPATAVARTPLPTIEVVQPERKRVRLLDVRFSVQAGYGYSLPRRASVLALGTEGHISFVELSPAAQLHIAYGVSGFIDPSRGWQRRSGMLGADVGLGLSRHVAGGPALVATVTAGPRWNTGHANAGADIQPTHGAAALRVDGWGVVGKIDAYPFYRTIPEIVAKDAGWFREYILSGLHLWALVRYDALASSRGPTIAGGIGLDIGRTLLLPMLVKRPT
jgi:hypothetical protein